MHVYSSICKWLKKGKLHPFIGRRCNDFTYLHPLWAAKSRAFTPI